MKFLNRKLNKKGFTMIEMLVTTAIFGMMTLLLLFNYPSMTASLAFRNASDELTYALKGAQVTGSSRGGDFAGDGVYFDISTQGKSRTFIEYKDVNSVVDSYGVSKSNKYYNNSGSNLNTDDALVKTTTIQNGVTVSDLCVKGVNDANKTCTTNVLSVAFLRPSPDAIMTDYTQVSGNYNFYNKSYIEMSHSAGSALNKKCIVVYKYGEITVVNSGCSSVD